MLKTEIHCDRFYVTKDTVPGRIEPPCQHCQDRIPFESVYRAVNSVVSTTSLSNNSHIVP